VILCDLQPLTTLGYGVVPYYFRVRGLFTCPVASPHLYLTIGITSPVSGAII
jgi:hypothetical protein